MTNNVNLRGRWGSYGRGQDLIPYLTGNVFFFYEKESITIYVVIMEICKDHNNLILTCISSLFYTDIYFIHRPNSD